ncbi:MAG TPA: c-type cytochrome [Steroidobacteraceae bacterium]|nr:c-type cytochrome [Steroidobacteraceae bacterium]
MGTPTRLARLCVRLACAAAVFASGHAHAVSTAADEVQGALRLTPDLARGERAFETCAACHGADGTGAADGSVPAIAGQYARVLMKQVVAFRHDDRLNIRMQHFVDSHHLADAQQLADVIGFVSSLPPRMAPVGAAPGAQGAELYARHCRACHGDSGQGDERRAVPRLAGQHPQYVLEQLQDAAQGRRASMQRDHTRALLKLQDAELGTLAAYASALRASREDGPSPANGAGPPGAAAPR